MDDIKTSYIALGGNLGDVKGSFSFALNAFLDDPRCGFLKCSRLYETEPWGDPDQPKYINAVAEIEWNDSAESLVKFGFQIEKEAGRDRENEKRWGPRKLDIDLLFHENETVNNDFLTIPHPRISERNFVLIPLLDLMPPSTIPPTWTKTIVQAYENCEDSGIVVQLTENLWNDWSE